MPNMPMRGPVLIDTLERRGYDLEMFTSASFSYPEFDSTVFAAVDRARLHEFSRGEGWQRDRENVGRLLESIDRRDPARPFMRFMFFESPHARYWFPPENEVRRPYLEGFNYATLDERRDMGLVKNRYLNACNHLDGQLARVFRHLERSGLLDSTIVIVTGDHGEEFMEHGRWGHNSDFAPEQMRPPLLLHVPGRAPAEVTRLTSHLDIPVTVLRLLGVENDPRDYAVGYDLLGPERRDFTIVGDWNDVVYCDAEWTALFPVGSAGLADQKIWHAKTMEEADAKEFLDVHRDRLVSVMRDLKRFSR
jgi:uncharacterized protein